MTRLNLRSMILLSVLLLMVVFHQVGCAVVGIRLTEEHPHEVLMTDGKYEIRDYEPAIIARTEVDGSYDEVGRRGFRRLGGYIFGDNVEDESIAMTAPVEMIPETESVEDEAINADRWTMTFVMPEGYTRDSLPDPTNSNVILEETPRRLTAVVRFTGLLSDDDIDAHGPDLLAWVETQGYRPVSTLRLAGYDPPWTIPFLRRNEVQVDVEPIEDSAS